MLIKSYLLEKNLDIIENINLVLFYGENFGLKNEFKKKIRNVNKDFKIVTFFQEEILNNNESFFNELNNISLFENKKIYFIEFTNDKILETIEVLNKKKYEQKIFLFSQILEKKSKLRNFFEKHNTCAAIPCYADNELSIKKIISDRLRRYSNVTPQIINLITENANLDRTKLENELNKIETYFNNKVLDYGKIEELLDIRTNQDVAQLKDHAFLGNKTKTNKLLSDTVLEEEKNIYYLNMINQRLNKLNDVHSINSENLEIAVNSLKPPIFWKDKDNFIAQAKKWDKRKIKKILNETYNLELRLKSNTSTKNILFKKLIIDICNMANS